jgi:hypothetical protein
MLPTFCDVQRITPETHRSVEIRSFGGAYEARTADGFISALDCSEKGALEQLGKKLPAGCTMTITRIRNR